MVLVAIDVDGTLASAGGPVTRDMVKRLESKGARWGILSSRSEERSREACKALDIQPEFIKVCRVDMRAEELAQLQAEMPQFGRYVYVADRDIDRKEAKRAGWRFVPAHALKDWEQGKEA